MISLAWHTVRARTGSLVGTFLALSLGVALLAAMALTLVSTVGGPSAGPRWYVTADVVVAGPNTVSVTTGSGDDRETESLRAASSRAVPARLAARLSELDATVVVDVAGYGVAAGAPGDTVRSWSAASLHPYTWASGGAPRAADDLVLSAPTTHRPGDRVTVLTASGAARFTVSGVLATEAPAALYVTDSVAADVAGGRIEAVAVTARPGGPTAATLVDQVREADGGAADGGAVDGASSVQVLTGDDRRRAEPDPDADKRTVAIAMLSATTGLAAFVSIFVVSGTFTYAVAARRREFGLLRAAGATARQVFRLVIGEALAVGIVASLVGGALGAVLAPAFARRLARTGFAPSDFTARFVFWPVAAAFGVGLTVALLGAWLAARRAGRVRPVEALREAAVDARPMTTARTVAGVVALGGCVPLVVALASVSSADSTALAILVAMLLVVAFTMFAPLLIPPLVWLLTAPLAARRGAVGVLARHSAATAVRRTAATAAPVLVTVGIAGATLVGLGTLQDATRRAATDRIAADAIVVPDVGTGLPDATVTALRDVPGVLASVPVTDSQVYVRDGDEPEVWTGRYARGEDLASVLDLPVVAGDLADLTGTDTVVVPSGRGRVGETFEFWLGDSTPVRLRVVAVLAKQLDLDETVLLPWELRAAHAREVADTVYLRLAPDAPRADLREAASAGGGVVVATSEYLSAAAADEARTNRQGSIALLGTTLLYTTIAIANTLVMATRDRARDLAALRLAGATPRQVLSVIGLEAVLVTCVGVVLAVAVTAVTAAGVHHGLADVAPSVSVVVPWLPLFGIVLLCLVTAVTAALVPAALLLRRPAAELAGERE